MSPRNNLKTYHYECPKDLQEAQLCGKYYFEEFNKIRTTFSHYKRYINEINSIEDTILRHVALYLVENFEGHKQHLTPDGTRYNNIDCEVLNRWLDQRKSFYTYGNNCKANERLWDEKIKPLWDKLNENNICARKEVFAKNAYIPKELLPLTCYKYIPENYECAPPLDIFTRTEKSLISNCKAIKDQCNKCKTNNYHYENYTLPEEHAYTDMHKWYSSPDIQATCAQCPSKIITITLSICITFFGTLIILYFLYRFTPLGAKLPNGDRGKKNPWKQLIEEEEYEEFEEFRNINPYSRDERSELHYQYMEN